MIRELKDIPSFKWATVIAVNPTRIRMDGDSSSVGGTIDHLIDPKTLAVGNRVRVELSQRKAVIHGKHWA